jgi:hypothetical protein
VPLEQVNRSVVLPARRILGDLPGVALDATGRRDVIHGRAVADGRTAGERGSGAEVALLADGELIAVAEAVDGWLRPKVVLETE